MRVNEKSRIYAQVKNTSAYKDFIALLRSEEADLRQAYESQVASEYLRGKLNGIQLVLRALTGE